MHSRIHFHAIKTYFTDFFGNIVTAFRLLPYLNNFSNLEYRIPVSAKKREKERRGEIEIDRERKKERERFK